MRVFDNIKNDKTYHRRKKTLHGNQVLLAK
jgi:hypothetical protein